MAARVMEFLFIQGLWLKSDAELSAVSVCPAVTHTMNMEPGDTANISCVSMVLMR